MYKILGVFVCIGTPLPVANLLTADNNVARKPPTISYMWALANIQKQTMRHSKTIPTLIFILISSLSFGQDFIKKHKTDKISLTEISDSIKIGFETDSAIIY